MMVSMIKKLKDVTEIISGYTFRSSIKDNTDTSLYTLQAKDITRELYVNDGTLLGLDDNTIYRTAAFVNKNDVVLSSRGSFKSAVSVSNKKILASSSVYIIRIINNNITPEYLALFLNSERGQRYLLQSSSGAAINTILKKDLENIAIMIPELQLQKSITNLHQNSIELSKLLIRKAYMVQDITNDIFSSL